MRPSTYSLSPFLTYFSTMSASCELFVFHTTQRCHSVFSCFAPLASFHERLVASENVATRFPPVVERTSGSFPRFPISVTLFKLRLIPSSLDEMSMPRPHAKDKVQSCVTNSLHTSTKQRLTPATSRDTLLQVGTRSRLSNSASSGG